MATDPYVLPGGFPAPESEAAALSRALTARLHQQIAEAGGWLPFDAWMETALYAPGLGYYAAGSTKFGEAGDFITAPLVTPLFAWTLAAEARRVFDRGGDTILEFGPGDGSLARDLLSELDRLNVLPARYLLLERSADLRARQQQTLSSLPERARGCLQWLDRLPSQAVNGLILANEVADALPVKRFRRQADGVEELGVVRDGAGFAWQGQRSDAVARAVEALELRLGGPITPGYESELCPSLAPWMGAAADALGSGAMVIIDYGYPQAEYYHPERHHGTLRCHYRHRAHDDPFLVPGLQDLTAHVDFSALAEAAMAAGLQVTGFAPQAQYLMGAGMTDILQARMESAPEQHLRLAQQAKTLVMPGEMGERFQVLAVSREAEPGLAGFSTYNRSNRL